MTSGLLVSTETGTAVRDARRSMTGMTRASSSSADTGAAPGRVDSPPTSTIAAPSVDHALGPRHRGIDARVPAAVGEGIRGDVQHAHDVRLGEVEDGPVAVRAASRVAA